MLRLVTNIPLPIHLLLLVLIPVLRLPSFNGGFFLPEESFYLLAAQKLALGGHLYTDLWHAGPPLIIWLYRALYGIFGNATLPAIRVLACLYLYLTSVYLAGTISLFKPYRRYPGLPAILLVFLASSPWYTLQVGASFLVILPVTIAFFSILQLGEKARKNNAQMFQAGIWLMICVLISYRFLFLVLGLLVAYLLLKTPRLAEVLSLFGGMALVFLSMILILFYSHSLGDYWELGIRYFADRIRFSTAPMYPYEVGFTLQVILRSWGVVLLLGLLGFIHFRIRFFSYLAQVRTIELTMAVWLVASVLMLSFKYSRLEISDFLLLTPPLAFYASKPFDFKWATRFQMLLFPAMFLPAMIIYLCYWGIASPDAMATFYPADDSRFLHGGQKNLLERSDELFRYPFSTDEQLWIMDYAPQYYLSLGQRCENQYLDFRILWYKLPAFPETDPDIFFSQVEREQDFYEELSAHQPTVILDPFENFPALQQRYPVLFGNYQKEELKNWKVYRKR